MKSVFTPRWDVLDASSETDRGAIWPSWPSLVIASNHPHATPRLRNYLNSPPDKSLYHRHSLQPCCEVNIHTSMRRARRLQTDRGAISPSCPSLPIASNHPHATPRVRSHQNAPPVKSLYHRHSLQPCCEVNIHTSSHGDYRKRLNDIGLTSRLGVNVKVLYRSIAAKLSLIFICLLKIHMY